MRACPQTACREFPATSCWRKRVKDQQLNSTASKANLLLRHRSRRLHRRVKRTRVVLTRAEIGAKCPTTRINQFHQLASASLEHPHDCTVQISCQQRFSTIFPFPQESAWPRNGRSQPRPAWSNLHWSSIPQHGAKGQPIQATEARTSHPTRPGIAP